MRLSLKSLSSLFLLSLSSKVIADQCQELSKKYDIDLKLELCITNSDGLATEVTIYNQDIKENDLKKLTALENIRLTGHLSQTNINEIATLTNLRSLYLSGINFNDLDFSPLSKIKDNLKKLYFYGNEDNYVTEFPKFVFSLKLEELYLAEHKFKSKTFPDNIGDLKTLKKISVGFMEIVGGIDALAKLENIEEIDLSFTKIDAEIPESLNKLKKLKEFNVYDTGIRGKALTNDSLRVCFYGKNDKVCKTKELPCLSSRNDNRIKNCEEVSDEVISTNGRCGNGNGRCPDGYCCSKYGHCGTSEDHCYPSRGCQSKLGDCFNYPVSNDGECGPEHGRCPSGQCCSKYGYCGNSDKHCLVSNKCQSEFGKCREDPPKDVRCGEKYGSCPRGQCCNKNGYCGITNNDCSVRRGCQQEYGVCYSSDTSKCGDFVARCPEGECCSKYYWCGRSEAHCGIGCRSEFGICN